MADAQKSLRVIFDEASERSGEQRRAYLDQACGGDSTVRAEVEDLLRSEEAAGGFLADPKRDATAATVPISEREGDRIGRYKLLQKIGEGGCGVVYMAEQTEPVKRRVALKVIKLGLETHSVIARFEAERQALAMMDHPNIAKILDAGTTEAGRPYFVMELVRGIKITDYCEQNQLTTRQRLELFIKVCQAVQHAHQKGIIHRDLKPSNVLVTSDDGVPLPKVIDFGIAKATSDIQLTDKTLFTRFDLFIGTPAYMSPEQAEFNASDIDTRTDIYALGVLLYELLTGQTPFEGKELLSNGLDAMRKIIREREPLRPSTRLSQTLVAADVRRLKSPAADTPSSEEEVRASLRRLLRVKETITLLRGDLDWIVLKALEKDRTRRYDTANGLAADIQRHLSNEPVFARPPSTAYKVQKAWQRNKLAFAAVAAVALALVVGISVSTWQAIEANNARKAEKDQRLAAQAAESMAVAKRREAEQAQVAAEIARVGEASQRRRAEARTYAGDMNLAQQAVNADNLALARQLLDRYRPQPGQPDRRGWEWRYLWQQSRSDALHTLCRQQGRITGLELSHNGQWLAIRTSAGRVSVWNLPSRREVLRAKDSWNAVAFSPASPLLAMWNTAAPGSEGWLQFWDAATGKFRSGTPISDPAKIAEKTGLAFLPDGQSLVAQTRDELSLWRVADSRKLAAYPIAISQNGIGLSTGLARETNLLAIAGQDLRIRVMDLTQGRDVFSADAPGNGWLESAALSADGRLLATCSGASETVVRLWDVARGRPLGTFEGHRAFASALVFWPDGRTLASASADKTIRIWDVESRRSLAVLRGHEDEVCRLALHPDKSTLISAGRDGAVMVWTNVTTARRPSHTVAWKTGPYRVFYPKWSVSSAGDELLTIESDGWLKRWHGAGFQHTESLFQIERPPKEARFSQDHRWLATHDDGGDVKIWNIPQRRLVHSLRSPEGRLSVGKFLGNTTQVAVWNKQARMLAIYDAATGDRVTSWSHPDLGAASPKLSADGRWCITRAGGNGHLRELSTGRDLGEVPLAGRQEVGFSPDGSLLLINYGSGTVRLWELPSLIERDPLTDILAKVHWTAFSPNERRLVMQSDANESLKLWDLESSRPMLTLSGDTDSSRAHMTTFTEDGSTIVVLHDMGNFDFWRAPSWEEITAAEAREMAERQAGREAALEQLREDSVAKPEDTGLALKLASLQVWFGKEAEYDSTRQRLLTRASDITSAGTADLVTKLSSLRAAVDEPQQAAILALGRKGRELTQQRPDAAWFELSLGMAEYRCGHYADAETTLRAAGQAALGFGNHAEQFRIEGLSSFYRAMTLLHLGRTAEARELFTTAESRMPPPTSAGDDEVWRYENIDDIILALARQEARALMQQPAPTARP